MIRIAGLGLALLAAALAPKPARPDAGSADAGSLAAAALTRPVQINADKLEVLGRESRAIYEGHAKAVRDTTVITCDRLVVSYSSQQEVTRIDALGNVRVTDGDRRAKGEQADFDNATGVMTLTGKPEAHQGGSHVKGTRVVFTSGEDVVDVENAQTVVEDTAGPQAKAPVLIDAKHLRIFGQKNQAEWTGKVKARRDTTLIKGNRLIAYYGPDKQLTRLEALGGAEAEDGDRWAKGDRADYDPATGVLVVSGDPEARQGKNWMRGEKVTFTAGSDKLEVEKPKGIFHQENP